MPTGGTEELLRCFDYAVASLAPNSLFFAQAAGPPPGLSVSMIVGMNAAPGIRLYAWVTIRNLGSEYEWNLLFSETRGARQPDFHSSHFAYNVYQEERFRSQKSLLGDEWLSTMWNLVSMNVTTSGTAQKARWFEAFIVEQFMKAVSGQTHAQNEQKLERNREELDGGEPEVPRKPRERVRD
jgi:hypothetical protein